MKEGSGRQSDAHNDLEYAQRSFEVQKASARIVDERDGVRSKGAVTKYDVCNDAPDEREVLAIVDGKKIVGKLEDDRNSG